MACAEQNGYMQVANGFYMGKAGFVMTTPSKVVTSVSLEAFPRCNFCVSGVGLHFLCLKTALLAT